MLASSLTALVVPFGGRMAARARLLPPPLESTMHKGSAGRIGVLGGSPQYTGAPYYAAMAALNYGADIAHVFCAASAAAAIKAYSPELIVTSVYDGDDPSDAHAIAQKVIDVLPRLHALVVGPGLGRNGVVLDAAALVIAAARARDMPVVVDADGLFLVAQQPDVVRGYGKAVLTPNAVEMRRIGDALGEGHESPQQVAAALGLTVVAKGHVDVVAGPASAAGVGELGCARRCGGLGDILAGSVCTSVMWAHRRADCLQPTGVAEEGDVSLAVTAAWAASVANRRAGARAFAKHKRATTAPDVLAQLGPACEELWPCVPSGKI